MKRINYFIFLFLMANLANAQFAYRSIVATGNWNANTSWERYSGTAWVAATTGQYPGLNDTAYIQIGHTISLTQNESCYSLNLNVTSAARLVLAGFKLNVYGYLGSYNSAINVFPVTYSTSLPSLVTWINTSVAGSAIRIVGNTRNVTTTGQWGNNPPGWDIEFALNSGQTATLNTGLKANRITISSGTVVSLGTTGNDIRPDNSAALSGDLFINSGCTYITTGALRRTGTVGAQFDTLFVGGTLELAGTSTGKGIDAVNLVMGQNGKIKHTGSTTYTSVVTNYNFPTGSSFEYSGTVAQTVGAEFPATVAIKKLIINNPAGVTFPGTRTITDSLVMTAGNITIPVTDSLVLGTSANGTLIRTSGSIIGKLNRYIHNTTTGNVLFPVGSANFYRPVNINLLSAPMFAGNVTIAHIDNGISGSAVPNITDGSYTVNRRSNMNWAGAVNGFTALNILLSIDGNGLSGINTPSETRIIGSNDGGLTFGLIGGTHVSGSGSIAYRTGFQVAPTTFALYLGGNSSTNPLPVNLIEFNGQLQKNVATLKWATASETNNKGFEIERSLNGKDYESIGFVNGAGNSNKKINYLFHDDNALFPVLYYRLKQIDFDGVYNYSEILILKNEELTIEISPNPITDQITVSGGNLNQLLSVDILDISGKIKMSSSNNGSVSIDARTLTQGIYFVRVKNGEKTVVKQIIKN